MSVPHNFVVGSVAEAAMLNVNFAHLNNAIPTSNVKNFGAIGNGIADDTLALQAAFDAGAGGVVELPKGTYRITNTLYVPPATTIRGQGHGDHANIGGDFGKTTIQLNLLAQPAKRIWTDVGLAATAAGTLVDAPLSVGIVLTGGAITLENIKVQGNTNPSETVNAWDVLILAATANNLVLKNVETQGTARYCGLLIDNTWSNTNTALQTLHTTTYGRSVTSHVGSNGMYFDGCDFFGGDWAILQQGTIRTNLTANVWSPGGASDLTAVGCRVGNTPIIQGLQGDGLPIYKLDSGGYKRDIHNVSQNRQWLGCSFRVTSGCSVYIDRGGFEKFVGADGTQQGNLVPSVLVTKTIDALATVTRGYAGSWNGLTPREVRIYLTDTVRIDPITSGIKLGALYTTSTGSFNPKAISFDVTASRAFLVVDEGNLVGAITAGQTLTQAAGQTIGGYGFYATGRAASVTSIGLASFNSPQMQNTTQISGTSTRVGGTFRSAGIVSDPQSLGLGAQELVEVNCENTSELNLWINKYGTGSPTTRRLRFFGTSLESYDAAHLGSVARPWGTAFCTELNVVNKAASRANLNILSDPLGLGGSPWFVASLTAATIPSGLMALATSGEAMLAASDLSVAITASGVNGLDAGSEAANTWYYLWLIKQTASPFTVAGLLSASSTAPTMPAGYTHSRLIGAVRNDGSSNFIPGHCLEWGNGQVTFRPDVRHSNGLDTTVAPTQIGTSLTATSFTLLSCAAHVPAFARFAQLWVRCGAAMTVNFRERGATHTGYGNGFPFGNATLLILVRLNASQEIDYRVDTNGVAVEIFTWTMRLE